MQKIDLQFDFDELDLKVSDIVNAIGYKEDDQYDFVSQLIRHILPESAKICKTRAEYVIFNDITFNDTDRSVVISDVLFSPGRIIYEQLKRSRFLALFLSTAGDEISVRCSSSMSGGALLEGYIFDVIGSEMVESAVDLMMKDLKIRVGEEGMKITNRYSPGYCGWDVAEQHKLFELVPENYCGIRLTESSLMHPLKSVSGIIGIGNDVVSEPYKCKLCSKKKCIYRRERKE